MTFNKKITLFATVQPNGCGVAKPINPKTVWAKVLQPGITTQYSALSAGCEVELIAIMWCKEYSGQKVVSIDGKNYRVNNTGPADTDLHIKLALVRSG